jgi:hypothetical protein
MKQPMSGKKSSKSGRLPSESATRISASHKADDGRLQYALCIDNSGYPASLELHKLYQLLPPQQASVEEGYLRIVDESGEEYLYSAQRFLRVNLPKSIQKALRVSSVA